MSVEIPSFLKIKAKFQKNFIILIKEQCRMSTTEVCNRALNDEFK